MLERIATQSTSVGISIPRSKVISVDAGNASAEQPSIRRLNQSWTATQLAVSFPGGVFGDTGHRELVAAGRPANLGEVSVESRLWARRHIGSKPTPA